MHVELRPLECFYTKLEINFWRNDVTAVERLRVYLVSPYLCIMCIVRYIYVKCFASIDVWCT
jgi:hypothetical protein